MSAVTALVLQRYEIQVKFNSETEGSEIQVRASFSVCVFSWFLAVCLLVFAGESISFLRLM